MTTRLLRALPVAALLVAGLAAPAGGAILDGGGDGDVLVGTAKADIIIGHSGADRLYGKAGADRIYTGKDSLRDLVRGGPGPDVIFARYHDHIFAGPGDDVVRVVELSYTRGTLINCGPGKDTVYFPYGWLLPTTGCERIVR